MKLIDILSHRIVVVLRMKYVLDAQQMDAAASLWGGVGSDFPDL